MDLLNVVVVAEAQYQGFDGEAVGQFAGEHEAQPLDLCIVLEEV